MKKKWSYDELKEEALKYSVKKEFRLEKSNIYEAICRRGLLKELCSHMEQGRKEKWTIDTVRAEASKYRSKEEFKEKNQSAYRKALKLNIMDSIVSENNYVKSVKVIPLTKEDLLIKVLKLNNKGEFYSGSKYVYYAKKLNIFHDIVNYLPRKQKWTYSDLKAEALKYHTKRDFYTKSKSAYTRIHAQGLQGDLCSHLK